MHKDDQFYDDIDNEYDDESYEDDIELDEYDDDSYYGDDDFKEDIPTINVNSGNNVSAKKKRKKKKKIVYDIIIVLLLLVFVGSAIYLLRYWLASRKAEKTFDEVRSMIIDDEADLGDAEKIVVSEDNTKFVEIDGLLVQMKYSAIYRQNRDFMGWLTIPNTIIDYPVMYTPADPEHYIERDFNGNASVAGTLFIDYRSDPKTPSDNIMIYGHNMKIGTMFNDVLNYEDEDFYQKNKYITFNTIYGNGTYEVIAAFRTKVYDDDYTGFKYYTFFKAYNEQAFNDYVKGCQELTPYPMDGTAEYGDKLLTLSTCAYHEKNGRYVVVAKKLSRLEMQQKGLITEEDNEVIER